MAVSTPEHDPGDLITGVMLQITQHAERLALLDQREATHFRETAERLADMARTLAEVERPSRRRSRRSHPAVSTAGHPRRPRQAGRHPGHPAHRNDGQPEQLTADEYQPVPAPRWWKLDGRDREEALARLRAWVEQIYRPGYGHLAAALGPCWDQHPLCLYGLDWLMELWSVLYLTRRTQPLSPRQPSRMANPPPARPRRTALPRNHPLPARSGNPGPAAVPPSRYSRRWAPGSPAPGHFTVTTDLTAGEPTPRNCHPGVLR